MFAARLQKKGFHAARQFTPQTQRGDVLVDGLGGSVFLYVAGHDEATIERLVGCLQTEDYPGVIFTGQTAARHLRPARRSHRLSP